MGKIIEFIIGLFRKSEIVLEPVVVKKPKIPKPELAPGEFNTIRDLLSDLDRMFKDIKIMTPKKDSAAQRLVKKYGPYVTSLEPAEHLLYPVNKLESYKAYGFPGFLINYRNVHNIKQRACPNGEEWCEQFIVATQLHNIPFFIRKKGHTYYDVTYVLYDGGAQLKEPYEAAFTVEINKSTGQVTAMPRQQYRDHVFGSGVNYTSLHWDFPNFFNDGEKEIDPSREELKNHLEEIFCITYNMIMRRENNVNIIVKKGKYRATFTVPTHRWKYFFKDRMKVKTPKGFTKPIFHWVSSHVRHAKTGDQNVKTHMRGVRHFWWGGYEVKIVLPGKHSVAQASFNLAGSYEDDEKENMIDITSGKFNSLNDLFDGTRTPAEGLYDIEENT